MGFGSGGDWLKRQVYNPESAGESGVVKKIKDVTESKEKALDEINKQIGFKPIRDITGGTAISLESGEVLKNGDWEKTSEETVSKVKDEVEKTAERFMGVKQDDGLFGFDLKYILLLPIIGLVLYAILR